MTDLCGEIIAPQFGEYKYVHDGGSKLELILYWVGDFIVISKKEITLLIHSN